MPDIKKIIRDTVHKQLEEAKLEPNALDQPGAHVVVPGQGNELHVLVKNTAHNQAIDKLEAELGPGAKLAVNETDKLDLGDLGEWRDFVVTGVDPEAATAIAGRPLALNLFSAAAPGQDVGAAFFASLDLAFAIQHVISEGQLAIRPIPAGERDGTSFVTVTPELRNVFARLLGRAVDDVVNADVLAEAMAAWQGLQNHVAAAGLVGAAVSLGLVPQRPPVPKPDLSRGDLGGQAADASGLSAATRAVLRDHRVALPDGAPDLAWVEMAIDALPATAPDHVARELRELYAKLQEQDSSVLDDLFGDAVSDAPKKKAQVIAGDARLAQSRAYKTAQLLEGLAGLEVPETAVQKLADLMARALMPSSTPEFVIIAGPRHSAADRLMDLAVGMTGQNPLTIGRADVSEPGFPGIYGAIRGAVPTGADALLSRGTIDTHRDSPAAKAPIVVEDLSAVGAAVPTNERDAVQLDFFARLAEMKRTGQVNTFAKDNGGASEIHEVSLANTVFPMRWYGSAKSLLALIDRDPRFAFLKGAVVETSALGPAAGVNFLEQDLRFKLSQLGVPAGTAVSFSAELRAALETAYRNLGPERAYEAFSETLLGEVSEALAQAPAKTVTLDWSRKLTAGERQKLCRGEAIAFASQLFSVTPGGSELPPLKFSDNWEAVVASAQSVPELEAEIAKLRTLIARHLPQPDARG